MVLGMMGVPWETAPGRRSVHVPVEISEDGHEVQDEDGNNKIPDNDEEDDENGIKFRGGPDRLHISKKAINRYGATPGCPACREITRRGHASGRLGYNQNSTCRQRVFNKMVKDTDYKSFVDKHGNMKTSDVANLVIEEQQRSQAKWARQAITTMENKIETEGKDLGSMLDSL